MTVVETIRDDTLVFHQVHKRIWPTSQRDALFWSHITRVPDQHDRDASDIWVVRTLTLISFLVHYCTFAFLYFAWGFFTMLNNLVYTCKKRSIYMFQYADLAILGVAKKFLLEFN